MAEIAGYQLGRLLGQGAFGETYEAVKNGERVALKLIKEEAMQQGFDLRRFQREVRSLQKAIGPNVVRLLNSGVGQLGNETRSTSPSNTSKGRISPRLSAAQITNSARRI